MAFMVFSNQPPKVGQKSLRLQPLLYQLIFWLRSSFFPLMLEPKNNSHFNKSDRALTGFFSQKSLISYRSKVQLSIIKSVAESQKFNTSPIYLMAEPIKSLENLCSRVTVITLSSSYRCICTGNDFYS